MPAEGHVVESVCRVLREQGGTVAVTYDALGQVLTQTDPLGGVLTFGYDADSRITSVTDKNGSMTAAGAAGAAAQTFTTGALEIASGKRPNTGDSWGSLVGDTVKNAAVGAASGAIGGGVFKGATAGINALAGKLGQSATTFLGTAAGRVVTTTIAGFASATVGGFAGVYFQTGSITCAFKNTFKPGSMFTTLLSAAGGSLASGLSAKPNPKSAPVPDPEPVFKPNGSPDRSSPWYVSYRDAHGNIQTVGNLDGVHAEARIQTPQPGASMSKPFGWRTRDPSVGPEWVEGTVCAGCQVYPRELFAPGTRGAPGGPWGD